MVSLAISVFGLQVFLDLSDQTRDPLPLLLAADLLRLLVHGILLQQLWLLLLPFVPPAFQYPWLIHTPTRLAIADPVILLFPPPLQRRSLPRARAPIPRRQEEGVPIPPPLLLEI